MKNLFQEYELEIGTAEKTAICNADNVYQDGTTPMYRDTDGTLWAISGHSHMGQIAMFRGTCLSDLKKVYDIQTNFCVGHADFAFSGIRYPEGVRARGSIWPFGLYICPQTRRFFAFFHNETGWAGRGTAYDAFGLCDTPKYDSDFRHVGLMHSDDEGRTWTFDRWVLTGETVCFTERFSPEGDSVLGQKAGVICLGSGDFSMFADRENGYLYLFYNQITLDMDAGSWLSCDAFVARSRMREDGVIGDFVKYYEGSFCEAGNFGRETAIARNAWHPRVTYFEDFGLYLMSCVRVTPKSEKLVDDVMQILFSKDLIHWSEPFCVTRDGGEWGGHYVAMLPDDSKNPPNVVSGKNFSILVNHNGTDVLRYPAQWGKKS